SIWARKHPQAKGGSSALYGLGVWTAFHHILLPALGTVPAAKDQRWRNTSQEVSATCYGCGRLTGSVKQSTTG
ncbi:DUF1440 domain-containing protein, partial [Lactiplantibacillus pentosus]|uniref:DUF1440 domain-containing protein n=1 Tax=Lactiplantibacillus pentosus TaxID=1589 RepID=UPI0028B5479E